MTDWLDLPRGGGDSAAANPLPRIHLRYVRPSLLDPDLPIEPDFAQCLCAPNATVLYLLCRPVAVVRATHMDQVSLGSWLNRIRSHSPREF